jgi:hypothetical protein
MGIVSSPETPQTDTASSKPGPHRWTGKELGILHSFYPLLSLDYEAYGTILPGISPYVLFYTVLCSGSYAATV